MEPDDCHAGHAAAAVVALNIAVIIISLLSYITFILYRFELWRVLFVISVLFLIKFSICDEDF